jgi:low affinity Fe/Cu permease
MSFAESFSRFAKWTAHASGRPATFGIAAAVILIWAVTGPIFHYSDTWQLFINTGTTIVTFLMVFLIQNTQNRDSTAMQIKLDELVRALTGAKDTVMALEDADEAELVALKARYEALAARARAKAAEGNEGAGARSSGEQEEQGGQGDDLASP